MTPHVSSRYPIADPAFRSECKTAFDEAGALVLHGFLTPEAVEAVRRDGENKIADAYFCASSHNVYLTPKDTGLPDDHPFNRQVISSKGLIADDQIDAASPLKEVYNDADFRSFVSHVVGEGAIHPYADALSAVNLHFAKAGQELGWHFDNSSFATTILIQKPQAGGRFEYVRDLRDSASGDMNFDGVGSVLDGTTRPDMLEAGPGTLMLFRGRDSLHRVTPTEGGTTRMLAVLAYNSQPGISLSESAMRTFYGRTA